MCVFCRDPLTEPSAACEECGVAVHVACAAELRRCPTLGCAGTLVAAGVPIRPRFEPLRTHGRASHGNHMSELGRVLFVLGLGFGGLVVFFAVMGLRGRGGAERERATERQARQDEERRRARQADALALERWLRACAAEGHDAAVRASCALLWAACDQIEAGPARDRVSDALRRASAYLQREPDPDDPPLAEPGPAASPAEVAAYELGRSALAALHAEPSRQADLLVEAGRRAVEAGGEARYLLDRARSWHEYMRPAPASAGH